MALILPVTGLIFGAGGATAVLQHDVTRHEKQIEALDKKTANLTTLTARVDERLSHIEQDLSEIKAMMKAGRTQKPE